MLASYALIWKKTKENLEIILFLFPIKLLDYRVVGLSDYRTIGLSSVGL